jgi:hypothetical protein
MDVEVQDVNVAYIIGNNIIEIHITFRRVVLYSTLIVVHFLTCVNLYDYRYTGPPVACRALHRPV